MKYLALLSFLSLFVFSCTKDCCEFGTEPTQDELLETIEENENEDAYFSSSISGVLRCTNNYPLTNAKITLLDESGYVFETLSNEDGEFVFENLASQNYTLTYVYENFHEYTYDEFEFIKTDLSNLILSTEVSTTIDEIAYQITGAEIELTTLDLYYFTELQNGDFDFADIDFPWRFILQSELDMEIAKISNQTNLTLDQGEEMFLDVVGIYYGDPDGMTCN